MAVEQDSIPISAVIIARDAEETIGAALNSLRRFDEVTVYDNGSQDRTRDVAGRFCACACSSSVSWLAGGAS